VPGATSPRGSVIHTQSTHIRGNTLLSKYLTIYQNFHQGEGCSLLYNPHSGNYNWGNQN